MIDIIDLIKKGPIITMNSIGSIETYKRKLYEAYDKKEKDINAANEAYSEEIKMVELKRTDSINLAKDTFYVAKLNLCRDYLNQIIKCHPFCLIYDDIRKKAISPEYSGWLSSEILTFVEIVKAYVKNEPNLNSLFSDDVTYNAFEYDYNRKTGEIIFKEKI